MHIRGSPGFGAAAGLTLPPLILAGSLGGLLPSSRAATESGPIVSMVPAWSIDGEGRPVDPRFTFAPTDPQILITLRLNPASDLVGSPLTFTWF